MQGIEAVLNKVSDLVWSWPLIVLLFGTHIYLTIRLKFIQRYIVRAIKISFSMKREGQEDISQFGRL
jgi:AGCS family alanine or glycine:cation symporter